MKFKFFALALACMILLSCNQSDFSQEIERFNNHIVYMELPCGGGNKNIYTKKIKKEYHQQKGGKDMSTCTVDYAVDGRPLKYSAESAGELVLQYAPDGNSLEVIETKNNRQSHITLIKKGKYPTQAFMDRRVVDYSYNNDHQLTRVVYRTDDGKYPWITYTYQWRGNELISSCLIHGNDYYYSEYAANAITLYGANLEFLTIDPESCEQVKEAYVSKDFSKFKPIKIQKTQCEETNQQGDCVHAKTFIDGKFSGEQYSTYEYY